MEQEWYTEQSQIEPNRTKHNRIEIQQNMSRAGAEQNNGNRWK